MPTLLHIGNIVKDNPDLTPAEIITIDKIRSLDVVLNFITRLSFDNVIVLKVGTGGGKSTLIPAALQLLFPERSILVTEPSRAITTSIPKDVCVYNHNFRLGDNIGFQTGPLSLRPTNNGITYLTPAILGNMLLSDDPLNITRKYSHIILDEVHKHDINIDFNLKLIKDFITNNKEHPKFILMSATLEYSIYKNYFKKTKYLEITGESFIINEHYPTDNIVDIKQKVIDIINTRHKGEDILVFVPSFKMIKDISKAVDDEIKDCEVYAISSKDYRDPRLKKLNKPSTKFKRIIVATNAAETGLTLPFLKVVIDTGMATKVDFYPLYNASSNFITNISKSSVKQRKGRVGRKTVGEWYPLFTKETESGFEDATFSELVTSDMSLQFLKYLVSYTRAEYKVGSTLEDLDIKTTKAFEPDKLDLIFNPSSDMLVLLFDKLYILGFIDGKWKLTVQGYLASFFTKITIENIKMIFSALKYGVNPFYTIIMAAMIDVRVGRLPLYMDYITRGIIKDGDEMLKLLYLYRDMYKILQKKNGYKSCIYWCEEIGISFITMITVCEFVYEVCEIFTNITNVKLVMPTFEELEDPFYMKKIKKCIYEGYKLNMVLSYYPIEVSYKSYYKPRFISVKGFLKKYNILLYNKIMYRYFNNQFTWCGDTLSLVLDDVDGIDTHPIY